MKQVSTSDGGNGNEGAKQNTSLARFAVANKGASKTKITQTRVHINLNVSSLSNIGIKNKKKASMQKNDTKEKKATIHSGSFVNFSQSAYLSACVTCGENVGFAGDCTVEILFRPSQAYISGLTNALDAESSRILKKLDEDHADENNENIAKLNFDTILYWAIPLVGLAVCIAPDGRLFCFMKNSSTYCYTQKYRIKSYAWRHLSISLQSCRPTIFIDGVQINVWDKIYEQRFGYIWSCLDAKVNHEAKIQGDNFFAGSISQATPKEIENLNYSVWEGDISDIRVWKIARNSKDISRCIGRNLLKSFPMYYDEAYQSKGLVGYFPFVENVILVFTIIVIRLQVDQVEVYIWWKVCVENCKSYTTELVSNLTDENIITSSFERMNHDVGRR